MRHTTILGLDFGSSSVKAAVLKNGKPVGRIVHGHYKTHFDGIRAEADPMAILRGFKDAVDQLGSAAKKVDVIAIDVMSPSWLAMDKAGKPLTPIITHQDRRSVAIAHQIEKRVGKARHLRLAGNRPFPGGISSTTCAWFLQNEPALMKKADLVGHLSTFLHRTLNGARVTDPLQRIVHGFVFNADDEGVERGTLRCDRSEREPAAGYSRCQRARRPDHTNCGKAFRADRGGHRC